MEIDREAARVVALLARGEVARAAVGAVRAKAAEGVLRPGAAVIAVAVR